MGRRNIPDEGWTEEGALWLNSLSVEDMVDLKWLQEHGVEDDEDQQKLDTFRESYEQTAPRGVVGFGVTARRPE
ncbi:hypothetical protein [Phycicoccus duodecadis]|uniref:Uncharacterized protein n=1 Tax=Phycicoccus duodecadis TaxID=173053 RepID=A0A2N3YIK2_9MICO|nr:hypothetical protein [Phycicoccus duodecadis]PKW26684.1 hypothetical protein ATL31_1501 [Phycicoccus duodecadis]